MNETFWDAQNLEIEACANFDDFPDPEKFAVPEKNCGLDARGTPHTLGAGAGYSQKCRDPVKMFGICACLNLEVLSVPEGLAHSIGIVEAPGVFLARRWLKS